MDIKSSWSSCTFELEDIEIIDHKNEYEELPEKWYCDQCSLFFLDKEKLDEHKKKHVMQEVVKCKYCNKTISHSGLNKESYSNRKCETCEYKCSKCPQRFLRLSSLVNHEKKHSTPKKKRTTSNTKKLNGIPPENVSVSKGLKRKRIETDDSEEQFKGLKSKKSGSKKKQNSQVRIQGLLDGGEDSSFKSSKRLSFKVSKSAEEDNYSADPPVMSKRLSLKTNKLLEENSSGAKVKQNSQFSGKTQAVSPTMNTSVSDNVVNYKPFSCHLCGDTFASDCALLDHIKTHGENAAKSFKCKFCGDEFDDIYKMQYHLAICPLAEDELESSLKQAIPPNTPTTFFGGTSSSRKRGRPKKTAELPSDQESSPYSNKRGNMRKRKSEMLENNEVLQNDDVPSLPKQSKNQSNKPFSGPDSNRVGEEKLNDSFPSDATVVTKEMEPDEDRKKVHKCPFPRCDFKFTREKALLCHMRNHSDDFDDSLKCHKCDIPFDDIQTLRLHINMCKGLKEEKDDDFNRARCYDSSPNRTFQRTKKDFVCNQCGKSYQSQDKLNRCTHEDLQTEGSKICRICGVEMEDEKKLKKHFNSIHPKNFPYQCPTCKAEFDSSSAEHIHRMAHAKKGEEFTCVICEAKFITYKDLYFHYSKDHVEQAQSICNICNITFPNNMALEEHNYVRHKSDYRFKCIFCSKAYSSSVSLTTHLKSHTSQIFKCKICYRPFTDTATLFQHMLFHASTLGTERPLKCAVCLAGYAKQSALKYHISGHITKNASYFNCLICGESMQDLESMTNHIFDHSIRITENNLTKTETEWVAGIKERKPVLKRGRPRLISNLDPELKFNVKVERDDFKQNIKVESEEAVIINRGRGRPRKVQIESEKTSETKRERGRPRKQPENKYTAMEEKSVANIEEGISHKTRTTRRSCRLIKETNLGEFEVNKEIKEERDNDMPTKTSVHANKHDENTVPTCQTASDVTIHKVTKAGEELTLSSSTSKRLKKNDAPNKNSNEGNKATNEPLRLTPEVVTFPRVPRKRDRNKAISQNYCPPAKDTSLNSATETKVKPLSFKLFSSLNNKRTLKVVKEEFKNNELTKEEMYENSSLVDPDSLDVKEEVFDDFYEEEEDPLGGIEIPYVSTRTGLRSNQRSFYEKDDSIENEEITSGNEESKQLTDNESRYSDIFIQEKKYFEPSRGLTRYSCTTCLLSFSSQEQLLFHNTTHI